MVANHYRWDFIGLSTDTKPTPETSEKVVDGSTYYCSDNSKLYVFYKDTWYEKTVSGGGGTSDFDQLTNRPKYNGVTMDNTTNIPEVKTYSDFVGTDGTSTGAAGLVPAPATTDAGKFLKADGTWEEAGGSSYTAGNGINITNDVISAINTGQTRVLTTADYNANNSNWKDTDPANFNCVSIFRLDPGIYTAQSDVTNSVLLYIGGSTYRSEYAAGFTTFIVGKIGSYGKPVLELFCGSSTWMARFYTLREQASGSILIADTYTISPPVQTTGTSTTDIMSQKATTDMVYGAGNNSVRIRGDALANESIAIGHDSYVTTTSERGVTLGRSAQIGGNAPYSVAIGAGSLATQQGQFDISLASQSGYATSGYNNSKYRLLTGLYDGQSAHDAATVAQGNTLATSAPTTSTEGVLGQLYTDTTNMHTYQCTAIDTTDPDNPSYTWTQRW